MFSTKKIEWELARSEKYRQCYVPIDNESLKNLQKIMLDILKDFDKLCTENDIEYMVMAGTLIGAVRHDGYVPWDDDIDVVVKREDYDRLKDVIEKNKNYGYDFITYEDTDEVLFYGQFTSLQYKDSDIYLNNQGINMDTRLYIDVVSIDNVPKGKVRRFFRGLLTDLAYISISSQRCFKKHDELLYEMSKDSFKLKLNVLLRKIIALPTTLIGKKRLIKYMNKQAKNTEFSGIVTLPTGVKRYFGEMLNYNVLFPTKSIKFEDMLVPVPANYDKYLTQRYGDYMKIPDNKEQNERLVRLRDDWKRYI